MKTRTAPRRPLVAAFALVCTALAQAQPGHIESNVPAALEQRGERLEAETAATEAVRAAKRLQHAYGHYAEAGLAKS